MVECVEAVKEELEEAGLLGDSPKNPQGGRPKKAASQEKVAEHAGTSRRAISEAQTHVAAVDKYPFMQPWPQWLNITDMRIPATPVSNRDQCDQ